MEQSSDFENPAHDAPGQGTDMQKALLSIRQARDSVLAQNHELISKLARADEELAVSVSEREGLECERDVALKRAEKYMRECEELRLQLTEEKASQARQIAALSEEAQSLRERSEAQERTLEALRGELQAAHSPAEEERLAAALQDATRRIADLEAQADGFKAQQKKNIISLTQHLTGDRELLRARFNEEVAALQAQIHDLQTQLTLAEKAAAETGTEPQPGGMLTERAELHRLEIEELAAQLEATRIENRELRNALDGARMPAEPTPASAAPEEDAAIPYDVSAALGAMSSCVEMLHHHPGNLEPMEELDSHLRSFSERAGVAGLAAIQQYSATCGDLSAWLLKSPAKISPATLEPLGEAVELLGQLLGYRGVARISHPSEALVYVVDDDLDNCECVAMGLEKLQVRTKYAVRPEVALAEIVAAPCDLIILDVDMPRMDGFELASHIRQAPHHAETPIIFLSGLVSTQQRLQDSGLQGAIYMAKPYSLKELGLRVLGMILKSQTALA